MWRNRLSINHFSLRLVALSLAVILWFVATERPQGNIGLDQRRINTPLALRNASDEYEAQAVPESVYVTVEGPRLLLPFQIADVEVAVDLSGLGPGVHTLPVQVKQPTGIAVKSVEPREVRVSLEARAHLRLPVSVAIEGVPPGLSVQVLSVSPREIDVYGAASAVQRVAYISARAPYGAATVHAPVVALGRDGQPVEGVFLAPAEVEVTLKGIDSAGGASASGGDEG